MKSFVMGSMLLMLLSSMIQVEAQVIFRNDEIKINFFDQFAVGENKAYRNTGFFSRSNGHVVFGRDETSTPTADIQEPAQQVSYATTRYLCDMYILPLLDDSVLEKEIEHSFNTESPFASLSRVDYINIGEHRVVTWRYQMGKTRLDHFMVRAKGNYYLFISSPYGNHGDIEKIIAHIKLLK